MGWLTDLLKQYPALEVARERLALADAKYESLERENETLKFENARLKGEVEALRRIVPSAEFVEARGVLFKRKADGSFETVAYCPSCKTALSTIEPNRIPMRCNRCKFMAPFHQRDISGIVQELQRV